MPEKKSKCGLGNATLTSVKREMAEPRMTKSARKESMKQDAARIARKAGKDKTLVASASCSASFAAVCPLFGVPTSTGKLYLEFSEELR